MRSVPIPALGRSVPRLGVGCASIMGRVGRRDALDGLAAAYEGGARYFDVARSYGYGRAERVVGEFLRGRRDDCVIATKAGILPAVPGLVNRVVLPVARRATALLPALQKLSARRGAGLSGVSKGNFAPETITRSVETSLRELAVDGVDLLLLHDVTDADVADEGLRRCLEEIVRSGKARAVGLATHADQSLAILRRPADETPPLALVQVPSHIASPNGRRLREALEARGAAPPATLLATHSSLAVPVAEREALGRWLADDPARLEPLRALDAVGDDGRVHWPRLLLGWALASNPAGLTLCGMLDRRHAADNLRTAERVDACAGALRALGEAWERERPGRS